MARAVRSDKAWRQRKKVLAALGYPTYGDYLASPRWQRIRGEVLARDGRRCICGHEARQVHHRRYSEADLLGETLDFMVSICRPCHKKVSLDEHGTIVGPDESEARLAAIRKGPRRRRKRKPQRKALLEASRRAAATKKMKAAARLMPDGKTYDVSGQQSRFHTWKDRPPKKKARNR